MNKFLRKEKGITLVALIITILVMMILVGVSISIVINSNLLQKAQEAGQATKEAYEQEGSLSNITIGEKTYNSIDEYIAEKGLELELKEELVKDGSWDGKVNTPKLLAGMTAVAWDSSGNEFTPETNAEWYNYEENKWANATTSDGSYWVWVPRFEYKIDATGASTTTAGTIGVNFIPTSTQSGVEGYTTTTASVKTVGGTTVSEGGITINETTGYIIHPAFTNKVEVGGWRSEIDGIWVAKFEMSGETSTNSGETWSVLTTSTTANDAGNGNKGTVATGETRIRAVSKPGVTSWRSINIANAYTNSYNYDRAKESHLMKNSEWGAVAYLTHSQYGRNGQETTQNTDSSYLTGGGSGEAYKTNVGQSSTGNVTGIYDLNGGAYDRVAAFNSAYSGTYYTGADYIDAEGHHFAAANGSSNEYKTAYSNSTAQYYIGQNAGNKYTSFEAFEQANHKVSITGDAIKEVWVSTKDAWFGDHSSFVNASYPFFDRGGSRGNTSADSGVFYANADAGGAYYNTSFRVCLVG